MIPIETIRLEYPRVTEIIGIHTASEMRNIPIEILGEAQIRGKKVHSYCTAFVKGLWIPEIEEECLPYVNAFTCWYKENV